MKKVRKDTNYSFLFFSHHLKLSSSSSDQFWYSKEGKVVHSSRWQDESRGPVRHSPVSCLSIGEGSVHYYRGVSQGARVWDTALFLQAVFHQRLQISCRRCSQVWLVFKRLSAVIPTLFLPPTPPLFPSISSYSVWYSFWLLSWYQWRGKPWETPEWRKLS